MFLIRGEAKGVKYESAKSMLRRTAASAAGSKAAGSKAAGSKEEMQRAGDGKSGFDRVVCFRGVTAFLCHGRQELRADDGRTRRE